MNRSLQLAGALVALAVAFVAGVLMAPQGQPVLQADIGPSGGMLLLPQDRQPPPPPGGRTTNTTPAPRSSPAAPLVYGGDGGSAASANGILAVTGSYGVGTSVLFLVDTNTRQLAVYEARGGSPNSRRVFLVGARKIDLDMQLEGYNDESEFSYQALRRLFDQHQGSAGTGARPTIPITTPSPVAPVEQGVPTDPDASRPGRR